MTARYLRSTDGSDADNGSTWALAKATLGGIFAIDTAGDDIWVSQANNSSDGSVTVSCAGTLGNPSRILCGDDAAQPPTALATTAVCGSTGTIAFSGFFYCYGISFQSSGGAFNFNTGSAARNIQTFEKCQFILTGAGAVVMQLGPANSSTPSTLAWKGVDVKFGAAGQFLNTGNAVFTWNGGSILAGGTSPTVLVGGFDTGNSGAAKVLLENLDLSNASAGLNIFDAANVQCLVTAVIRNCKLPASWSGSVINGSFGVNGRAELYNCAAGSTRYTVWIEDYLGSIKDEGTIVRTGGFTDPGANAYSLKMASSANATMLRPLRTPEFAVLNTATGSSITLTCYILHDSATALKDDEVWIEANYLGDGTYPIGTFISDRKADVLATGANQDSDSSTWTTTGMSNPNTQKLVVTFTPQKAGPIAMRVALGKASKTIYVDLKVDIT